MKKTKTRNVLISIEIMLRCSALFVTTVALLIDYSVTTFLTFALCVMALAMRAFDEIVRRDSLHSPFLQKEFDARFLADAFLFIWSNSLNVIIVKMLVGKLG